MAKSGFKRILLKVSGEVLAGDQSFGIEPKFLHQLADQIADVAKSGVEVAIVIGAGNIFRGMAVAAKGGDRVTSDLMGMLGTVINSLALGDAIEQKGLKVKVYSNVPMETVADTFTARDATRALAEGYVVVCAGGTGSPFFTTDTAAALRATEMGCDAILKGTKVDGVYSADPKKDPKAERYDRISLKEAFDRDLKVLDATAFALARENSMPIIVFSIRVAGAIEAVLRGKGRVTVVGG